MTQIAPSSKLNRLVPPLHRISRETLLTCGNSSFEWLVERILGKTQIRCRELKSNQQQRTKSRSLHLWARSFPKTNKLRHIPSWGKKRNRLWMCSYWELIFPGELKVKGKIVGSRRSVWHRGGSPPNQTVQSLLSFGYSMIKVHLFRVGRTTARSKTSYDIRVWFFGVLSSVRFWKTWACHP